MEVSFDKPHAAALKDAGSSIPWATMEGRIKSRNSIVKEGLMKILNGDVKCTGSVTVQETLFKVYYGGTNEMYAMFECIGGDSVNWMICVDSDLKLSARKKAKGKIYATIDDAEEDVLFAVEILSSPQYRFRWVKEPIYMGFDKLGLPIPLNKVDKSKDEAMFDGLESMFNDV